MIKHILVLGLLSALAFALFYCMKFMAGDRWQFIASVPVRRRRECGEWDCVNITWYGFIIACSIFAGMALALFLLASAGIPLAAGGAVFFVLLFVCIPCSRLIAFWVERRKDTFTVAGASFAGAMLVPWVTLFVSFICEKQTGKRLPVDAMLAAIAGAVVLGEGLGRLACISFGCCYGKPLDQVRPLFRRIFRRFGYVFNAETKKAVYASGLAGVKLFPVQGLTAVFLSALSIAGVWLFLDGRFVLSLAVLITGSQLWRFFSEFMRADYRGGGRLSAYQLMSVIAVPYVVGLGYLFNDGVTVPVDRMAGLKQIWNPAVLIMLQVVWWAAFLRYGISTSTGSSAHFFVKKN